MKHNNPLTHLRRPFSTRVGRYRQLIRLEHQGKIHIGTRAPGGPLYLDPAVLNTHLMIQAPTGGGKSCLARVLFRSLIQLPTRPAVWADDPKHDLYEDLAEDCAVLVDPDRVTVFDTSNPSQTLSFNPLRKNGIAIADHVLWILSAIRSCWGQESFSETPQRPRWLFNALFPVIEADGSFTDAMQCLNYQESQTRQYFMERTSNRLIKAEWEAYERLNEIRRRDETASAYAWLRPFCINPITERVVRPQTHSLDLGEILRQGEILLTSFPRYRPLDQELTNFLRSLLLQSMLAQALHIPLGERPPLYIILDEAEHVLAHDTGVIDTILNEGRSLGIHLILLFHNLEQVRKKNPALLASVITNCRSKILGGGLSQADLNTLVEELFVTEWHPYEVREERWELTYDPIETTRRQISEAVGGSETHGYSFGTAFAEALTEGMATHESESDGITTRPDYPTSSSLYRPGDAGTSQISASVAGISKQLTRGAARSIVSTLTTTHSEGETHTESRNWQHGVTVVPFHEMRPRLKLAHREYVSLAEFLTRKLQKVKRQLTGHWAIKTPHSDVVFFKAVWVTSLVALLTESRHLLQEYFRRVTSKPYYALDETGEQPSGQVIELDSSDVRVVVADDNMDDEDFYS